MYKICKTWIREERSHPAPVTLSTIYNNGIIINNHTGRKWRN